MFVFALHKLPKVIKSVLFRTVLSSTSKKKAKEEIVDAWKKVKVKLNLAQKLKSNIISFEFLKLF